MRVHSTTLYGRTLLLPPPTTMPPRSAAWQQATQPQPRSLRTHRFCSKGRCGALWRRRASAYPPHRPGPFPFGFRHLSQSATPLRRGLSRPTSPLALAHDLPEARTPAGALATHILLLTIHCLAEDPPAHMHIYIELQHLAHGVAAPSTHGYSLVGDLSHLTRRRMPCRSLG